MLCLKLLQYRLVIIDDSVELYAGAVAVIFTAVGIAAGKKIYRVPQLAAPVVTAPAITVHGVAAAETNRQVSDLISLSKREHEILRLMAEGYSNQQIADAAFVSVSTVKTHVSNLFVKLDVARRTQAVKKAKELNLID